MSVFSEIKSTLEPLKIPIETGVFSEEPPDEYIVIVPLSDTFDLFADNSPEVDICEVRLSIYSKHNYLKLKRAVEKLLMKSDFTITDRRYVEFEKETRYHHYAIDAAKFYMTEEVV